MSTLLNAFTLEAAFKNFVTELRHLMADRNVPDMQLKVVAKGRTHGELKIEFTVSEQYGVNEACSGRLQPAVDEFFRRRGWTEANAPLCLTYANDDATSFPNITESAQ